jgi:hypothetical protein
MFPDLLEPVGLHVHEGDGLHHAETDQEHVRLPVGRVGKNPGFKKKPAQCFFFLVFLVFWVFCLFWFFYIFAQKREFLGFSQFQEYF